MNEIKENYLNKALKIQYQTETLELKQYMLKKRRNLQSIANNTISQLFSTLENEQLNMAATCQVHLSETIEMISGMLIPETIRQYRGFIINLEKIKILFNLFTSFFHFFNYKKGKKIAYSGYSISQEITEILWNQNTLVGLTRPSEIIQEIPVKSVLKIKKNIIKQQKKAWKIAKIIDKDLKFKKFLENIDLTALNIKGTTGLTGPIIKAMKDIQPYDSLITGMIRKSSSSFLQEAYTNGKNLWYPFRVCYAELLLAINRAMQLLQGYPTLSCETTVESLDGETTSSFPTPLGISHLTMNILNNTVKYFNYIPPEMVNYTGIVTLLSNNTETVQPLLLIFLNPEITLIH